MYPRSTATAFGEQPAQSQNECFSNYLHSGPLVIYGKDDPVDKTSDLPSYMKLRNRPS